MLILTDFQLQVTVKRVMFKMLLINLQEYTCILLQETEGTWKWTDGSTVPSQYWASGEPNDLGGEDCAYARSGRGNWNDIRCSRANIATFACQTILN